MSDADFHAISKLMADLSPSSQLLGTRFIAWDEDTLTATLGFTPPPSFASPRRHVQGGLVAGFLDEAMGAAFCGATKGEHLVLNLDLNLTLMRPVPIAPLTAKGRAIRTGKRVAFLEAELFDEAGEMLARATSTALSTPAADGLG